MVRDGSFYITLQAESVVKLRRIPEDFLVEELADVLPGKGPFSLYRLTKRSLGTPEAIAAIARRLNLPRNRISYGGLKDRHAVTVQYLTIRNGPRRGFQQTSLSLDYLGQQADPWTPASFLANRFRIVMRDLSESDADDALAAVDQMTVTGIANYFDDQRFGSLGCSGEWIARPWCLGDYERALWLALADPHPDDSAAEKIQKQRLQTHWGDWVTCKGALDRSHRRSIVTFLADKVAAGRHPDFRGAFARISVDLRGLYLSAWQSALWNRMLSRLLVRSFAPHDLQSVVLQSGPAAIPVQCDLNASLPNDLDLPLPSARIDRPDGMVGEMLDEVLAEEQIALRQLRVKYPRDSFFSKGTRRARVFPRELTAVVSTDELYARRRKLLLGFDLPRGSYATMVVKCLMLPRPSDDLTSR